MPRISQLAQQVHVPMALVPRLPSFLHNPFTIFTHLPNFERAASLVPWLEKISMFNGYVISIAFFLRLVDPFVRLGLDQFNGDTLQNLNCSDKLAGFTSLSGLSRLSGLTALVKLTETVMSVANQELSSFMPPSSFSESRLGDTYSIQSLNFGIDWPTPFNPQRCTTSEFNGTEGVKMLALGVCIYQTWIYSRNNPTLNQIVGERGALLKSAVAMYFLIVLSDAALITLRA